MGLKQNNRSLSPLAYSAMAAILLPKASDAEVIYTDIDPDVTVDVPGTGVELDLDGNGVNDFNFFFTSSNFWYATYWGGFNFYFINAIIAAPQNENAIAAFTGGGGAYAYPYAIGSGIEIGPYAGNFLQNDYQTLAFQFYAIISSFYYFPIAQAGEWVFGEADKFIGLKLAEGDSTYYGWIRLTVDASNRAFTIKDIAVENLSDTPIETFFPLEIAPQANYTIDLYSADGNLFIHVPNGFETRLILRIYDLQGKLVYAETGIDANYTVACQTFTPGNYIVTVLHDGHQYAKQLWLGN